CIGDISYQNISSTDIACSWTNRKPTDGNVKTIAELFPKKKVHQSVTDAIPDSKINEFKAKLSTYKNAVGLCWLLNEDPKIMDELVDVESIVFSEGYLKAEDKEAYLLNKLSLKEADIYDISVKTRGQSENDMWLIARKNRLTSSNFGAVLAASRRNKCPPSLFRKLTESYTLDGIKAIQWGKQHEANGVKVLEERGNFKVQQTGIWLRTCGYLGGSPDGLVEDYGLVEVKCPFKLRASTSLMHDLKDKSYILFFNDSNELVLNTNHDYYHQIQGNLWLTNRKICYLVIWTPNESLIYNISIDNDWATNIMYYKDFIWMYTFHFYMGIKIFENTFGFSFFMT
ncbi:unnamed protein product, partial [Callosobruchus maculatus]